MKRLLSAVSICLAAALAFGCGVFANAAGGARIKVCSAQSLFEPFEAEVRPGSSCELTVKLRSDKKIVNSVLRLGFDSEYLQVTGCSYGDRIESGAVSNITEQWQLAENNVVTFISSGKFYDYTEEDVLVSYRIFVKSLPAEDLSLTLDFVTLTANDTVIVDGAEDMNPDGDVSLIAKSNAVGSGFDVSASLGHILGDVDGNGTININDATAIQLYLVGKAELSDVQRAAADTYADSRVNIRDVTMIQLWLVQ